MTTTSKKPLPIGALNGTGMVLGQGIAQAQATTPVTISISASGARGLNLSGLGPFGEAAGAFQQRRPS
jgi:hypothetical protein